MTRSILALMLLGASAVAQEKREKTVILVHGAFADGSSWDKVIPLLEAKGLHVVAVEPLASRRELAARLGAEDVHEDLAAVEGSVPIHQIYELEQIQEAHATMEKNQAVGKLVVRVRHP